MGKRLIQQRRGRGTHTYRSPSFRFRGEVKFPLGNAQGKVVDIVNCPGHSAPLMEVAYDNGMKSLSFAPEGICVGNDVACGTTEVKTGNILLLRDIPEGTLVHNLELRPGDGGKLVRSSGTSAKIVAKSDDIVRVLLPSKKEKVFLPDCRAAIGLVAGGGKVGEAFFKTKKKNF